MIRRFSFSFALVVFVLVAFSRATLAQTSVYATGASTAFGFSGDNYPHSPSLKPRTTGFTAGVFYMLPSTVRFKPSLDAHVTSAPGYNGGKAYTGAIRVSFIPYRFPLRPYGQFGGGMASTQLRQGTCSVTGCNQTTTQIHGGVVQYGGGLDIHINRLFDIRAFNYEADSGGTRGLTSAALRSYSAGLVFHLPSRNAGYR